MTAAAMMIILVEWYNIRHIEIKYFGRDYEPDPLELLSRLNIEDMLKYRHHTINSFLACCLLTMARLFG
jgi:hypothetical protein